MLLSEFFEQIYRPKRLRGKSENSVRLYRLCVRQFSRTLVKPAELQDLNEANVLRHLSRRGTVAVATRNKELAELTAMWRLASQMGLLTTWPDIRPEDEPQREPIAWLADELQRLLRQLRSQTGDIGGVPAWLWWMGMVRVILDTGERVGAVRSAKWSWVQGEWLRVPAEARKGKTRDRQYRLSPQTISLLRQIRQFSATDSVFPWPYNYTYLWAKWRRILEDADLPTGRKYGLHALRKTVGSVVYAAGMDPQDILDHSDRRTTQRYLDSRFTRDRQACDVLAEFLANPRKDGGGASGRRIG